MTILSDRFSPQNRGAIHWMNHPDRDSIQHRVLAVNTVASCKALKIYNAEKKHVPQAELGDYYKGQRVQIHGTGPWWTGNYDCTIVDLRSADQSVKVQYEDGGYKRYPLKEFNSIISQGRSDMNYGTQAAEWYYENYMPKKADPEGMQAKMETLQEKTSQLVREGKFEEADKNHKEFLKVQRKYLELKDLESQLVTAVRGQDFVKAADIKKKLDKVKSGDTAAPASGSGGGNETMGDIITKAAKRAAGGGLAGAVAMGMQVTTLMWIRTVMNYQYRYGTTTKEAFMAIYKEGGGGLGSLRRFYRGYGPALFQGPMSRFGDTAANAGVLSLMNNMESTKDLPIFAKTLGASAAAGGWRIFLTPVDTVKTILQVEGKQGLTILRGKIATHGPGAAYHGAVATATATFVGHYPWFAMYNYLDTTIPVPEDKLKKLGRNAFIGFVSSVTSDTISNSLRVIKTYRQTSHEPISYAETVKAVVEKDGYGGLFGRGLKTRIIANGMQGLMFSVLWKYFDEQIKKMTGY